jgi:dTDP-4-amino-4,6-dideoxygalactose transaminase
LEGINAPLVRDGCRHVYYVWAIRYEEDIVGVSREKFSQALAAEGFPNFTGYVRPLYLLPVFQRRIAFGRQGYPFNHSDVVCYKGMCPVTERMWEKELMGFENCMYELDEEKLELLIEAWHKVYSHREELL